MEKKHIKYFQKQPELAAITFFKKLSWKTRALHLFSVTTTENIFFEIFKSLFSGKFTIHFGYLCFWPWTPILKQTWNLWHYFILKFYLKS